MKSTLFFILGLTAFFVFSDLSLRAEDWTTTDGKSYKNVSVVKTEPDAVTILHSDGGARVSLDKLPTDLQKRFSYDPAKAKVAADARTASDTQNAKNLQAEMDQAQIQRRLNLIASDPRIHSGDEVSPRVAADPTSDTSTGKYIPESSAPAVITVTPSSGAPNTPRPGSIDALISSSTPLTAPAGSNHHSMDDLVDINSRLKDDHPSPNRHTASSLLLASSYLMPDPLDPNHHSTDELVKSVSNLTPPAKDSTHNSMESINTADPLARP